MKLLVTELSTINLETQNHWYKANKTYLTISNWNELNLSGQVSCCYTDGCNQNIETARASLINKDVPSPAQTLQAFKLQPLLQVRPSSLSVSGD